MAKRDLFTELMEGVDALREEREGKITLRTTVVEARPAPEFTPARIKALREKLKVSQPVFADMICASKKTYQKWEQGQAYPNPQARLVLGLIEEDPRIIQKLAKVG